MLGTAQNTPITDYTDISHSQLKVQVELHAECHKSNILEDASAVIYINSIGNQILADTNIAGLIKQLPKSTSSLHAIKLAVANHENYCP